MFDFPAFIKASADNAPFVVAVVLALVRLYGKAGLKGVWQLASSLLTGLVIGAGWQIAILGTPTDFAGWFMAIIYGLGMGALASGVYEVGKDVVAKYLEVKNSGLGRG